ncbi:MAG TPA: response regulator transcription factor [Rubrobacteraceae bacterium]|jgi:DNA-binding NarL/FixJ family response regulator|nr:response regulator transcription factor [Rubrobacteraceae bacterium]
MEDHPSEGLIRVVLADDHTMFRQGIKEMLATDSGIEVVGEAENGAVAVDLARKTSPDVVILDVEMPVMGAREAMDLLLRISPPPRIVVVTMHDDPRLVRELLGRGASAYLVKSASLEELLTAVRAAAETPTEPHDENVVMVVPREVFERAERLTQEGGISARELEILLLAARGLSNRQIAARVNLAESTVKRHLANTYNKMNVRSRGEATTKALSEGWISTRDMTR